MKKSSLAITAAVALALTASGCQRQPQWNQDDEAYCVDDDGDLQPMRFCQGGNAGHTGMFLMYGSKYRTKYPGKYKTYSSKMRSSAYVRNPSRLQAFRSGGASKSYSTVSRGSGGSIGRSFGGGSFGG